MRLLAVLLLCPILFVLSGCATGGAQTKQSVTLEVLKPTHDALAAFQDTEVALFRAGELPQLTPQAHQRISEKLAIAFRSHALAASAIRTWKPGQPIPVDVNQLQDDVDALGTLLGVLAIPSNTPLAQDAGRAVTAIRNVVALLRNR